MISNNFASEHKPNKYDEHKPNTVSSYEEHKPDKVSVLWRENNHNM